MRKSSAFPGILLDTARQKLDAARARSRPDLEAEKPRDVILGACGAIAERLKADGYSFLKSGPKLKRTRGDLAFQISFQSDRNNIAGRRAAMWIHARVSSTKFARWRAAHPSSWIRLTGGTDGVIAGGQIGNLCDEPTWMEWNFADGLNRSAEVDDAVMAIRRVILPFFALFEDEANAVRVLSRRDSFIIAWLVEYTLMAFGLESAEAACRSFLAANPQAKAGFQSAFSRFSEGGIPNRRSGPPGDLAALAVATGMDLRS